MHIKTNSKLSQITEIYGDKCIYCRIKPAVVISRIIPRPVLHHAKKLNRKNSRHLRRKLPEISSNFIENLLPSCLECCSRKNLISIYKFLSAEMMESIDIIRTSVGFVLIGNCKSQRELQKTLSRKEIELSITLKETQNEEKTR